MSSDELQIELKRLKAELNIAKQREKLLINKLSHSRNIISTIFSDIEDNFYFIDTNFKVVEFNQSSSNAVKSLFNHALQAGDYMLDFVLPEHKQRFETVFNECLQGKIYTNETEHKFPEGSRWFKYTFKPVSDRASQIIGIILIAEETTKNKEIVKNLKVSQVNYQKLVDTIPAIIFRAKLENLFDVFYLNHQAYEALEYPANSLLHKPQFVESIIHIESIKSLKNAVRVLFESNKSIIEETKIKTVSGKIKTFYTNIMFILDEFDNPIAYQGILFDITEKSEINKEFEKQNFFIKSLLDAIPDLVFYKDTESHFLGGNKAFLSTLSLQFEAELIGKTDLEIMPDKTAAQKYLATDQKVLKTGKPRTYEDRFYSNKNKLADFETVKSPYFDKDENIIGIIGISRNIGERNIFKAQLRDSEEKFRKIFEQMYDGVIITNNVGIIVGWNNAAEKITGFKKEDIIGKYAYELNLAVFNIFDTRQTIQSIYDNLLLDFFRYGKADWLNKPNIDRLERKDGTIACIQTIAFPIQTSKGIILGIIIRDITETKQMEKEILIAKAKGEDANKIKSIILSNLGHELRTPLNSIIGFSEILVGELKDIKTSEIANYIYSSGINLRDTLNSLLALGDLESESSSLNMQITNLGDLTKNVISTFYEIAESKNLALNYTAPSEDILVNADYYFLQQSLSNIIKNALKFTDVGSVDVVVIKFVYEDFINHADFQLYKSKLKLLEQIKQLGFSKCAIIRVADTGKGIKADAIDTIFDAFRQVSEGASRIYDGVGIGLTISRRMIELMKGKILVESQEAVGSSFYIVLPLSQ